MDQEAPADLDPSECLRLLELPESATVAEIKRAYRRLAQRFHPDKQGQDETSRGRFIAVVRAYRCLMRTARLVEKGRPIGRCCVCRRFGEVSVGLDGLVRCPACLLRPGGRPLLPLPVFTVVRCLSAAALLVVAVFLMFSALRNRSILAAAAAFLTGLAALIALAIICLRVVYCIQPREDAFRRAARRKRRLAADERNPP
ncbi:MAG: J domain-containing protein [Phycisphaerae bacterium]|jgi:hypothetical protein